MKNRTAPASSHNHDASASQVVRFPNLRTAGKLLADKLRDENINDALVLAIACAGVPVGSEVAMQLGLPLDILLIRRLLAPEGPGSEIGATSVAGTTVLDEGIHLPAHPSTPLEHFIVEGMNQFHQRESICRPGRPPLAITARKILLVDCAIHTGSTMKFALRAVRKLRPAQIIAAVPVASREGSALIDGADELVWLAQPEPFGNAAMWYQKFDRPNDEDVSSFLDLK